MAKDPTYGWDWSRFVGSAEAMKWTRRDLPVLDAVMKQVAGRSVVVQAGGNLGLFPKRLAQEFQAVYTFDPDPGNFAKLMTNAPEVNIVKLQAALGDKRVCVRTETTTRRDGKPNVHEGVTYISGAGILPTLRIDDLGLHVCDLIYLDTEGCELDGLRGAAQTIERCRPFIALEINKNLGYMGLTPEDVHRWLDDQGYNETPVSAPHTQHKDHLFQPREWLQ
jgi:FkbM family methyltransferase